MLRSVIKSIIHFNVFQPDNIMRDNERGTYLLTDVAILGDRNVTNKEAKHIIKTTAHGKCKNKSVISNNRGN
jgi:hypothetical protein